MNTIEMIEVMQAFVDGEIVQYKVKNDVWRDACRLEDDLGWDWDTVKYRIKPKETLEDRAKAEYTKFDVVILGWQANIWCFVNGANFEHTKAQSMKGFYKYVYDFGEDGFSLSREPTNGDPLETIQPVAVLFSRGVE